MTVERQDGQRWCLNTHSLHLHYFRRFLQPCACPERQLDVRCLATGEGWLSLNIEADRPFAQWAVHGLVNRLRVFGEFGDELKYALFNS